MHLVVLAAFYVTILQNRAEKGDELCVQFRHIFKDMLSLDARCQQGWGALIRHPGGAIQYILHRLPGRESLQYD